MNKMMNARYSSFYSYKNLSTYIIIYSVKMIDKSLSLSALLEGNRHIASVCLIELRILSSVR